MKASTSPHQGCQLSSSLILGQSHSSHTYSTGPLNEPPLPPSLPPPGMWGAPLCPRNPLESHGSPSPIPCSGVYSQDHLVGQRQCISEMEITVLSREIATSSYTHGICYSTCCMPVCLHYQYFLSTRFET